MTRSKFISILLLTVFAIGYADNADAQFWKRKKHKHQKTKSTATTTDKTGPAANEEDEKGTDKKEGGKTRSQRKKEKKELKRKEKRERKEKEAKEKKEKKERKAKEEKEKKEKKEQNKKEKGKKEKGKKEKKGKDKKKKKKGSKGQPDEQATVIKKWKDIEYPASQKKTRYRIDILAPMYLDELVKNGYAVKEIPEKALPGLNFYKGVQIAADTLKKAQFDIDIYVHDVASLLESTEMLVRKNVLDSSDLIIGAVVSKDVPVLAAYAKTRQINFISALSPSDGSVKDNQFFTLLQPSLKSHCEWITNDIATGEPKKKTLLLYRTSVPAEDNAFRYLTDDPTDAAIFTTVLCNVLPKKETLAAMIDTSKAITIVVSVLDNNYADSILKVLKKEFPNTHFTIYGMPSWSNMASITKAGVYPNMTINVTTPFNYAALTPQTAYVERSFKKEYGGKPMEMVFRGYETMFWYANLLMRHGTIFNKHYDDNELAPFTKFELKPQWDKAGNVLYQENRHLFVHKYDNGTYTTR